MLCKGKHGYRERKRDDHIDQMWNANVQSSAHPRSAATTMRSQRRRGAAIRHRATIQLVCNDGMQLRTPVGASTGLIPAGSSLG